VSVERESAGRAYLLVVAHVAEHLREEFDAWYSREHLPDATVGFGAEAARRFWDVERPGDHYALYEFANADHLQQSMKSPELADLVAEFDRSWPEGVVRERRWLTLVEEMGPSEARERIKSRDAS